MTIKMRSLFAVAHKTIGSTKKLGFFEEICIGTAGLSKIVIGTVLLLAVSLLCAPAQAYQIPENMWQGLIAEATDQGYDGLYAVACCVRNRLDKGMSIGLCGLKRANLSRFCANEGHSREQMAKDIVYKVFTLKTPDSVFGATHYEAIERYGTPYWAKGMIKTTKIGRHTFYREKR